MRIVTPNKPPPRTRVAVQISLGKYGVRTLSFDAAAMSYIKKETGQNTLMGQFAPKNITDIAQFLYACTLTAQENEGKLTFAQFTDSVYCVQFKEAFQTVLTLMQNRDTMAAGEVAPYVPTHPAVMKAALTMARLQPGEVFLDLGCGNGEALAIAARMGAHAVGYELNHNRAETAKALMARLGAAGTLVVEGSITEAPWEEHNPNVIFCYLLADAMTTLKERFSKLPTGTRIVSHDFAVPGWKAARTEVMMAKDRDTQHTLYCYEVGKHEPINIDLTKPISAEDADILAGLLEESLAEFLKEEDDKA